MKNHVRSQFIRKDIQKLSGYSIMNCLADAKVQSATSRHLKKGNGTFTVDTLNLGWCYRSVEELILLTSMRGVRLTLIAVRKKQAR